MANAGNVDNAGSVYDVDEFDYSGVHWRLLDYVMKGADALYKIGDPLAPTQEDIDELYGRFSSLVEGFKPEDEVGQAVQNDIIMGVNELYSDYARLKGGLDDIGLKRGTTYHRMKAKIEAGKGNTRSAASHKLKAAGYYSLYTPSLIVSIATIPFAFFYGYLVCGPIECGKLLFNFMKEPDRIERTSDALNSYKAKVSGYLARKREKRELNSQKKAEFYKMVDDNI